MAAKSFNPKKCLVPTFWCGKGDMPKEADYKNNLRYTSLGTRDQCVQKGFGAGMSAEKSKNLPENSLQKIKYVGEVFEKNFMKNGIANTTDLIDFANRSNRSGIDKKITVVCTKKDLRVDYRAYNHILLWLYDNGIPSSKIPWCREL